MRVIETDHNEQNGATIYHVVCDRTHAYYSVTETLGGRLVLPSSGAPIASTGRGEEIALAILRCRARAALSWVLPLGAFWAGVVYWCVA